MQPGVHASLLVLALAVSGCHLVFSHAQGSDQRVPVDRPRDPDLGAVDGRLDAPIDAARTREARPTEAKPTEATVKDMAGMDKSVGVDLSIAPAPSCSSYLIRSRKPSQTSTILTNGSLHLVACEYPESAGPITQCQAMNGCGPKWRPCTVDDYEKLVKNSVPADLEWSWLKACVRSGGATKWNPATACAACNINTGPIYPPLMTDCAKYTYPATPDGGFRDGSVSVPNNVGLMSYYKNWCWYPPPGAARTAAGLWAPCGTNASACTGGGNKTKFDPRRVLCCYP